jgi:hypothetical protein
MKKLLSSSSNNETASKKQAVIFLQFLSLIYKDFFCRFVTSFVQPLTVKVGLERVKLRDWNDSHFF